MLRYRAAAFFARTTAPEVAMGLYTADELDDMQRRLADGNTARSATEALDNARDVTPAPEDESQEPEAEPEDASQAPGPDDNDRLFFGEDGA